MGLLTMLERDRKRRVRNHLSLVLQVTCLILILVCVAVAQQEYSYNSVRALEAENAVQNLAIAHNNDRVNDITAQLTDLKSIHISERLTTLEAASELNQKLLVAVFLGVVGLLIRSILDVMNRRRGGNTLELNDDDAI